MCIYVCMNQHVEDKARLERGTRSALWGKERSAATRGYRRGFPTVASVTHSGTCDPPSLLSARATPTHGRTPHHPPVLTGTHRYTQQNRKQPLAAAYRYRAGPHSPTDFLPFLSSHPQIGQDGWTANRKSPVFRVKKLKRDKSHHKSFIRNIRDDKRRRLFESRPDHLRIDTMWAWERAESCISSRTQRLPPPRRPLTDAVTYVNVHEVVAYLQQCLDVEHRSLEERQVNSKMVTGTNSNSTMSSTATSMATSTGPAEMATSTTTRRLSDNRRVSGVFREFSVQGLIFCGFFTE